MAIRGPQGPGPKTAPPAHEQPKSPTQRLVEFGAARTPQEAIKLLKEILTLLAAGGFPVAAAGGTGDGGAEQQLSSTLKLLQKQEGLPPTGQLDKKTFDALERLGLLPKNQSAPESIDPKNLQAPTSETKFSIGGPRLAADLRSPRAGEGAPAGTQKTRSVETEQARARFESTKPDVEVDLRGMLGSLKSAGFLGAGKGKEQLTDAVKKLQRVDGLPATGQLDARTADALLKRGVIDAPTALALKEQDPNWAPPAFANSDDAQKRTAPAEDVRGKGGADGAKAGKGDSGAEASAKNINPAGSDGRVEHGDLHADSDDIGNNYAGDDDDGDPRRGLANDDAAAAADAFDHWEVPTLAVQLAAALTQIVRDDDGKGPATYRWDVRLLRPGHYSARQPAEELLHLQVTQAGPFDAVWKRGLDALNEKLQRYERDAPAVDERALSRALQQARYR